MSTPVVRAATGRDLDAAAHVLALAFADYPWTRWTVPAHDHLERVRRLQHLALERVGLLHGDVWVATVDDAIASVAVWTGPTEVPAAAWAAMADEVRELEGPCHGASQAAEAACVPMRPTGAHRVLGAVGTVPSHQRQGLAAAVLAPGLARGDELGVPAYLETSTSANVAFYERLGFVVTGTVVVADGGPTVWAMQR